MEKPACLGFMTLARASSCCRLRPKIFNINSLLCSQGPNVLRRPSRRRAFSDPERILHMLRLLLTSPSGNMGRALLKAVLEREDFAAAAMLAPRDRPYTGKDSGSAAGLGRKIGSPVLPPAPASDLPEFDGIIDFSIPSFSMEILNLALETKKPLLCGTTGFTPEQKDAFRRAGESIPVMLASNTSFFVQLLYRILREAAEALAGKVHLDIIEMHSAAKRDAPSGTALEMAEELRAGLTAAGYEKQGCRTAGPEGGFFAAGPGRASGSPVPSPGPGPAEQGSASGPDPVSIHSVRSGDITSSHTVVFGGRGERLEFTHHAYGWECYARGALEAFRILLDRGKGFYPRI